MTESMNWFITFYSQHGIYWTIILLIIGLVIFLFLHPDKWEKWSIIFQKIFAVRNIEKQKKIVVDSTRKCVTRILSASRSDFGDLIPYTPRIEWADASMRTEEFISGRQAVFYINDMNTELNNIVTVVSEVVKKAFIPNTKVYLSENQISAIDAVAVQRILQTSREHWAMRKYKDDYLLGVFKKDKRISTLYDDLLEADREGFFLPVLINEMLTVCDNFEIELSDPHVSDDLTGFISFIIAIVRRSINTWTPFTYNGRFIKVAIVLAVAHPDSIDTVRDRMIRYSDNGIETAYIMASGWKTEFLDDIIEEVKDYWISSSEPYNYMRSSNGMKSEAVVIQMRRL